MSTFAGEIPVNRHLTCVTAVAACLLSACGSGDSPDAAGTEATAAADSRLLPGEGHLRNLRQLTFAGENAEAYFAFDGSKLIYQSKQPGAGCDQIYIMDRATGQSDMVSNGQGRTTCAYFYPAGDRIL